MLALLVFVTYWPVRLNGFVNYDDQDYLTQNPVVQRGLTWQGVTWAFQTSHSANWHPLTWLSHMADCQLFGLQPVGHHLVNVALHAVNAVLLFLLLLRSQARVLDATEARMRDGGGWVWRSALVAALFAVHPLHVESVAWAAERKDVLSTLFGLLSLHAYVGYTAAKGRRGAVNYSLAVLLFACSLLSKPMLVTLPFLLLLLDAWPLGRLPKSAMAKTGAESMAEKRGVTWTQLLLEKVPFLVLSILCCAVTLRVQELAMTFYHRLPLGVRISNAAVSYVRYLDKTFWPQKLSVFYPYPEALPTALVLGSVLLLGAVTAAAWLNWPRRPWFAAGWFWFCGLLVPVLGLVQVGVQSMADRYTYFPLVGLFIITAWGGAELLERWHCPAPLKAAAAALAVVGCGITTGKQLSYWRDTDALFTHAIAVTERNWVAHYNLASLALARYQDTQRSGVQQQRLSGTDVMSTGGEYLRQVVQHCEATIEAMPEFPDPRVTLAKALTELGDLEGARNQLETAVLLQPANADARENLAEILYRKGDAGAAVEEYRAALKLKPNWWPVQNNLAWVLATHTNNTIRNGPEAVRLAAQACGATGHTNLWYLHTLAAGYAESGDFTHAIGTAEEARRIAEATGNAELVRTAAEREVLYRSGKPLRGR